MATAITRGVSKTLAYGERTHIERVPIDLQRARAQHHAYEVALRSLGLQVQAHKALDDFADSVFVEDVVIALDGATIITRPGASSRRPETAHMTRILAPHRRLSFINAPGTIDGGDVVVIGKRILVGLTARTNIDGAAQLQAIAQPLGYIVEGIQLDGALHLKTALSALSSDTALANPHWIDVNALGFRRVLCVARAEPFGANVLPIGNRVLVSAAYPDTRVILEKADFATQAVDVSELHKAEAGITCMSVILD